VLTKPVGAGVISTAVKRGLAGEDATASAVAVMTTLNADAAAAARAAGAHALTDVTGFGLLGHLHELTRASGVAAELDAGAVPAIEGALDLLADEAAVSGGSRRNAEYAAEFASFAEGIDPARRRLVTDAMTSGGLLAAVPPARAGEVPGGVIGRLVDGPAGAISVRG
jgi:selenide,water dikinase